MFSLSEFSSETIVDHGVRGSEGVGTLDWGQAPAVKGPLQSPFPFITTFYEKQEGWGNVKPVWGGKPAGGRRKSPRGSARRKPELALHSKSKCAREIEKDFNSYPSF